MNEGIKQFEEYTTENENAILKACSSSEKVSQKVFSRSLLLFSSEKNRVYALKTILLAKLKILDFLKKIRKFAVVRYGAVFSNRGAVFPPVR